LAFHTLVPVEDVHWDGIARVSARDVAFAGQLGVIVRLLAICERHETLDGPAISARVQPRNDPGDSPLASVRGAYNAVFVESRAGGQAGRRARRLGRAAVRAGSVSPQVRYAIRPTGEALTRYHVALDVADRVGDLAALDAVRQVVSVMRVEAEEG